MKKLKRLNIEGEEFYYLFSFDIDDFIGDGVWWLQIYDSHKNLIYDKPFAPSVGRIDKRMVVKIIKDNFLSYRGAVL